MRASARMQLNLTNFKLFEIQMFIYKNLNIRLKQMTVKKHTKQNYKNNRKHVNKQKKEKRTQF